MNIMKDSGKRDEFSTGAVRDTNENKPRMSLISPIFMQRLGLWLAKGANKYSARNWEKGIPLGRTYDSLFNHAFAFIEGKRDEDHLAAMACNIMFLIHTEEMISRGLLPNELYDLPDYVNNNIKDVQNKEKQLELDFNVT